MKRITDLAALGLWWNLWYILYKGRHSSVSSERGINWLFSNNLIKVFEKFFTYVESFDTFLKIIVSLENKTNMIHKKRFLIHRKWWFDNITLLTEYAQHEWNEIFLDLCIVSGTTLFHNSGLQSDTLPWKTVIFDHFLPSIAGRTVVCLVTHEYSFVLNPFLCKLIYTRRYRSTWRSPGLISIASTQRGRFILIHAHHLSASSGMNSEWGSKSA